jgi:hypothetical protein
MTGIVEYEDKEYGPAGFTGKTVFKPVRYATVEVVDASTQAVLGAGVTGTTGKYSISFPYQGASVYARAIAAAVFSANSRIAVKNLNGALYSAASDTHAVSPDAFITRDITIDVTSGANGAFNVLDVYTAGFQYIHFLTNNAYPPSLSVFWPDPNGTSYCRGCAAGDGIYIFSLNDGFDSDEYDDDVLLHEFGHFIAHSYSKDDAPANMAHTFADNDLDLRLSWSEGWADFFPGAVKKWIWNNADSAIKNVFSAVPPPGMALSHYVDTSSGGVTISFDLGNPPANHLFYYSSSETAVAKVLTDVLNDPLLGEYAIWSVFTSSRLRASALVNLEKFWDSWKLLRSSADQAALSSILNNRSIFYSIDSVESDEELASSSDYTPNVSLPRSHTLYADGDADYVLFTAMQDALCTISTSSLTNGADTFIELYGSDGITRLAFNDNATGADYTNTVPNNCSYDSVCHENTMSLLASSISFTAPANGTYYVKVLSSPNRPLSAGKYGSYVFSITTP